MTIPTLAWIKILAVALPSALLVLQVLSWRSDAHKLPGVEAALTSCNEGKLLTKETNDALQKDRDRIARRLADAKRVPKTCVLVSGRTDPVGVGAEHAGRDGKGISGEWLLGYAATCETYRSERIRLESFINKASTSK